MSELMKNTASKTVSKLFETYDRHPLSHKLAEAFAPSLSPSGENVRRQDRRCDIVSPKLCDDLIKYLAPTLEQHKGCILIDVHPGAGLWSERLHNFLQPKRHILMEPEPRYKPFLDPLLNKKNSTYRLTELSGSNPISYWNNYQAVFKDPQLWPDNLNPLALNDPARQKLNPGILLIGNLHRKYPGTKHVNYGKTQAVTLSHMSYSIFTNELIHRWGRVRQLWWSPARLKPFLFGHEMGDFALSNWSTGVSLTTQVTEAAGCGYLTRSKEALPRFRRRNPLHTEHNAEAVKERMIQQKMAVPISRYTLPLSERKQTGFECSLVSPLATDFSDLRSLDAEVDRTEARWEDLRAMNRASFTHKEKREWADLYKSNAFPQMEGMIRPMAQRGMSSGAYFSAAVKADLMLRIIRLEVNYDAYTRANPDHSNTDLKETIIRLNKEFEAWFDEETSFTKMVIEDRIVAAEIQTWLPNSIFSQDKRRYEAIRYYDREVYPRVPLMLLDCLPSERDLTITDLAGPQEVAAVVRMILNSLYEAKMSWLTAGLERIAPGAAQDLIPMVPELTDPSKGGRWDPGRMRVKHLTVDMILGIAKAWFEWPFRPPMEAFLGEKAFEDDVEEMDDNAAEEGDADIIEGEDDDEHGY